MKDDYLWDGSGEPDPEIQKLETTMRRYRHNAPSFEEAEQVRPRTSRSRFLSFRPLFAFGAAAVLLVAATAFDYVRMRPSPDLGTGWDVARMEGTPQIESKVMSANSGMEKIRVGQTLVTDSSSRAAISLDETGRVEVDAGSRLRLLTNGPGRKRLSLERGTIHATIWAPPGQFVVDTPSAVAVDFGCVYTLHVDDSGSGLLRTTVGWVGFKLNSHESFIPAGAVCATRPKIGPGTPYSEDATPAFRDALSKLDFDAGSPAERAALLGIVLADARRGDALTLWHLLTRVSEANRLSVYDRLAVLAPPPVGVTRDGIVRLDQQMLDAWWSALGYGDISLWRTFEHHWSQPAPGAK